MVRIGCRHILDVHSGSTRASEKAGGVASAVSTEGEIDSATLKRYIAYARQYVWTHTRPPLAEVGRYRC